jgi:hypothetical protein
MCGYLISISIAGLPADYLKGDTAKLTVSGTAEHGASYAITVAKTEGACSPAGLEYEDTKLIQPGAFSTTVPLKFATADVYTVCAFVFDGGNTTTLLASTRAVSKKRPLEAPGIVGSTVGKTRKPSFAWRAGSSGRDAFILVADGQPTMRITTNGVAYYNQAGTKTGASDPSLGHVVVADDGTARLDLNAALPPGDYEWMVERMRDAGETAVSPLQDLHVSGPKLTTLHVGTRSHRGRSSKFPGYTLIRVRTTPFATVKLELMRSGRTQTYWYSWNRAATGQIRYAWTCKVEGASSYRYVVTARDDTGKQIKRHGRFNVASNAQCDAWRTAEAAARARARARERAQAIAQARREAAAYAEYVRRWKYNCTAQGGTPVLSYSFGETVWRCRGPYGFFITVPEP